MIIKKIKEKLDQISRIVADLEYIKMAIGRLELANLQNGYSKTKEFKVFSQWGEDGIIQWIIQNIKISREIFIEFGVQNYTESNTRFLLMNNNWSGLVIDGSEENINYIKKDDIYWRYNLKAVQKFITAENINSIFKENGIEGDIGLLSIDIDGNDYWVWEAINCINPDIVICEYNHIWGKEKAVTIEYSPDFVREKVERSCVYWGGSIQAFVHLAKKKGYSLVAGNKNGNNIFFVRNDLLNDVVREKSVEECFVHGKFRDSRNDDGTIAFYSLEEEQAILSKLPVIDVSKC
ncbi:NADH dehydrogenase [Schwartzia succinivorans]|jgi:hypothetical protein|uniref:Methyltransferase FkbM domain-containing protein n=1 Tax=Schwartzia succinivorans DSM 10502 TaxID=1123243 RepID=A0A1M4XR94_9FIRM|nr:NADH dehydrogenase [Schwartzia succinivorans]SHE95978.1 hypothetical protein SAMN02745190_01576 [Schwartzia succinivorans DSM 10502]